MSHNHHLRSIIGCRGCPFLNHAVGVILRPCNTAPNRVLKSIYAAQNPLNGAGAGHKTRRRRTLPSNKAANSRATARSLQSGNLDPGVGRLTFLPRVDVPAAQLWEFTRMSVHSCYFDHQSTRQAIHVAASPRANVCCDILPLSFPGDSEQKWWPSTMLRSQTDFDLRV